MLAFWKWCLAFNPIQFETILDSGLEGVFADEVNKYFKAHWHALIVPRWTVERFRSTIKFESTIKPEFQDAKNSYNKRRQRVGDESQLAQDTALSESDTSAWNGRSVGNQTGTQYSDVRGRGSPALLLFSYTTSDIIHTIVTGRMVFQTRKSEGQSLYATVYTTWMKRATSNSYEVWKYNNVHGLIATSALRKYEGDIQLEIIQLALDQITSLDHDLEQDANLPENVQRILRKLKCFCKG
ncbi:hypothetical protein V490_09006 [Pseudogymnoascus sp. VKM F-3557]|nr:hypothetical protein V490_09006 [Pseudogymnoascus sp. VKM F-3557]